MQIRLEGACPNPPEDLDTRGDHFCDKCSKTVRDLRWARQSEARRAFAEAGGGLCARLRLDRDGEPIFRPDAKRTWAPGLVLVSGLAVAGCTTGTESEFRSAPAVAEPIDVGPPMEPIPPTPSAVQATSPEGSRNSGEPVRPTPEQRALTRRKRTIALHPALEYLGYVY